jgi:hypothetical protein
MKRRDGNTTRLVDNAIQTLFTKGRCLLIDHHRTRAANEHALRILKERIEREHSGNSITWHPMEGGGFLVKLCNKYLTPLADSIRAAGFCYVCMEDGKVDMYQLTFGDGIAIHAKVNYHTFDLEITIGDYETPFTDWHVLFDGRVESAGDFERVYEMVIKPKL